MSRWPEPPPPGRASVARDALQHAAASLRGGGGTASRTLVARYADDPEAYIRDKLGWEPWGGTPEEPGQREVIAAYRLALLQQRERRDFEAGRIVEEDLVHWHPGEPIRNRIRVEAGHGVGKTKVAAGITSHFFDTCPPAIALTFAPSWEQIHDLLWKEIKNDREGRTDLPGRVLDTCEIKHRPNHFAKGRATNNSGGKGTERIQGQHGPHLLFVLDEAEGIPDFVYDAVATMESGGIVIVLELANPRTRTSRFHKGRTLANAVTFRIASPSHPNVIAGRDVIPGAVRREWVETMVQRHCEVVPEHEEDHHTFTLRFPVRHGAAVHPPGTIFRPDTEFLFRVLGIAPTHLADNTFVPVGRYEAAKARAPAEADPAVARLGLDVARFGKDLGTLYVRHAGAVRRVRQFAQLDTNAYARAVKEEALRLRAAGITSLHVRVDAGGGYGGGVVDKLRVDAELLEAYAEADLQILEVHFGADAYQADRYANLVTEMYAEAAESLRSLALLDPPDALEQDLCERRFDWRNVAGVEVRILEEKRAFKKRVGRSPDDGDGFVLATAPDFIFTPPFLPRARVLA